MGELLMGKQTFELQRIITNLKFISTHAVCEKKKHRDTEDTESRSITHTDFIHKQFQELVVYKIGGSLSSLCPLCLCVSIIVFSY